MKSPEEGSLPLWPGACDRCRSFAPRDLIEGLWESQSGVVSVQVLQEFFVNTSPKIGATEARRRVAEYSTWRIHAPGSTDVVEAIDIHRDYKISFWDAMIVRSASALDCDIMWSEDLNHGQTYRCVRVENPFV